MPYHIRHQGRKHGPLSEAQLATLLSRGTITHETEATVDEIHWQALGDFPEVKRILARLPLESDGLSEKTPRVFTPKPEKPLPKEEPLATPIPPMWRRESSGVDVSDSEKIAVEIEGFQGPSHPHWSVLSTYKLAISLGLLGLFAFLSLFLGYVIGVHSRPTASVNQVEPDMPLDHEKDQKEEPEVVVEKDRREQLQIQQRQEQRALDAKANVIVIEQSRKERESDETPAKPSEEFSDFVELKGPTFSVRFADFSPDGKKLVTASDRAARIWCTETGNELQRLKGHTHRITFAAYSPDGKTIATASYDQTVRIWDVESGSELKKIDVSRPGVNNSFSIYPFFIFSPDRKKIVTTHEKNVLIWDVNTGKELKKLEAFDGNVGFVVFSPDGKRLATNGGKVVQIWDTGSGKKLKKLEGHSGSLSSVVFSPDGKTIATASSDSTARIWDVESGKVTQIIGEPNKFSYSASVDFSPDGEQFVTATYDHERRSYIGQVWDTKSGRELKRLNGRLESGITKFSPNGKYIFASGWSGPIQIWDAESGAEVKKFEEHSPPISPLIHNNYFVPFSQDGTKIVVKIYDVNSKNRLRIWCTKSGDASPATAPLRQDANVSNNIELKGHTSVVSSVAFSPDGRTIATGDWEMTVRIWDVGSGKELKKITMPTSTRSSRESAFSPDGKKIVTVGWSQGPRIFDVDSTKELKILDAPHSDFAVFSPDGKMVVATANDNIVRIWNVESGEELKLFEGHSGRIHCAAFSPDGKKIVTTSSDKTVRIWDVESGKELKKLEELAETAVFAAFSPAGEEIVAVGEKGTVPFWNADSGRALKRLQLTISEPVNRFLSAALSPDGTKLATGDCLGNVQVWDADSGKELKTFDGHINSVTSVDFSPNGKLVASASEDGTAMIWDLETTSVPTPQPSFTVKKDIPFIELK